MKNILLAAISLLLFIACENTNTKSAKKKRNQVSAQQQVHIIGHDSLDVQLILHSPQKKHTNYSLYIANLDKSGFHNWKDTSWSEKELDTVFTNALSLMHRQPHRKAKNATYEYVDKKWKLKDEVAGTEIDTLALRKRLHLAFKRKDTLIDLRAEQLYLEPDFDKDAEELTQAKKDLEKALKTVIAFSYQGFQKELNKEQFAKWLSLDNKLKIKVDYIAAQNYIQDIAAQIEKPLSEILALQDSELQTDSLQNQTYPRMPIFQEVEFILKAIPQGKTVQRPIVFVAQGLPKGLKEGLKDFVEVSILDQKLWLFRDGRLVLETSVVTGNKKYNRATPTGHYHILYKTKDRILRGRDYASFVKYWMPFYKGYGLHDAMWRRRFGANIYQNGGSHGCVNIPPKMAPLVYDNVKVGMDVIIW